MKQFLDTHAHLMDERYEDPDQIPAHMAEDELFLTVSVGYNLVSSRAAVAAAQKYGRVFAAVGIHPSDAEEAGADFYAELTDLAKDPNCLLWGEIGLDYHYPPLDRELQKRVFLEQLELAHASKLPVAIHLREAAGEMNELLRQNAGLLEYGGIMHCYAQSAELVPFYLKLGLYLSFSGTVTFKNARGLLDAVRAVPLERILTETDSPYLTPEPFRGKTNQPAYVRYVAQKVAELKGVEVEALNDCVLKNFRTLCPRLDAALRND